MKVPAQLVIGGYVGDGFERVRDAFIENFTQRGELGGACSIYQGGEKVVDLWGGIRDRATAEPWREDTMVIVHSTTKGLSAMVMALAHSRGWLDYEERVATYWPEFAQNGKERITVRQLLAHQAGLFAFDEPVDREVIANLDRLAAVMARQRPAWQPGERQAYHAIALGFYEGELIRRVDPEHRSLGQVFDEEIAKPLGLDCYLRLPESIANERLARLAPPKPWKRFTMPLPVVVAAMNRRSVLYRSLIANPGTGFYLDPERVVARNLEAPSGCGVATARAIAKAYGVFASGGRALGLRAETLAALMAPAIAPRHGFFDECLRGSAKFSLGFMKPSEGFRFGSDQSAFGAPGAGGSMGYADPKFSIGYGYVTSQMGMRLSGDPRDIALRAAMTACVAGPAAALHRAAKLASSTAVNRSGPVLIRSGARPDDRAARPERG